MRVGGGGERWMVVLPAAVLAVIIMIYVGGPVRTVELLERFTYDAWDRTALLMRR